MPETLLEGNPLGDSPLNAGMLVQQAVTLLVDRRDPHAFGEVLAMVGEGLQVTRAAIVAAHPAPSGQAVRMEVRHQWLRSGTARLSPTPSGWLPYFPRWASELAAGRIVQGPVESFPADERAPLERDGVKAFAAVPITAGDRWYGHLSIDDTEQARCWTPAVLDLLVALADTIGQGIALRATEGEAGKRAAAREGGEAAVALLQATTAWRSALPAALEELRKGTRARSAWVYELGPGTDQLARLTCEALAPGALPATGKGRRLQVGATARDGLRKGVTISGSARSPGTPVPLDPALAEDHAWLRAAFEWLGVAAWIVTPSVPWPDRADGPAAAVGLDSEQARTWGHGEREALEAVAAEITERLRQTG